MRGKRHERVDRYGQKRIIIAICDKELLGKKLKQGQMVLDLAKYAAFYDGIDLTEEMAAEWIKSSRSLNLVGKKAIAAAKKVILVDEGSIKSVKGVPHLQVYFV